LRHAGVDARQRAQQEIVGVEVACALASYALDLGLPQARLNGGHDADRNLVLQSEHVRKVAVIALGPHMPSILRLNELARDADTVSRLTHTAFEEIAHA